MVELLCPYYKDYFGVPGNSQSMEYSRMFSCFSEQFVAEYCYDKMPASAKDQEWIHVAVTYNFLTKKCYLYINGERTSHKDTTG